MSLSIFNKSRVADLTRVFLLVLGIAITDWRVNANVPLGLLYLLPMALAGTSLTRVQIAALAAVCTSLAEEFDGFVQQPGLASYPYLAYVDIATSPAGLYVWPPASGNYPATVRYNPMMPDIVDTSQVPWFPNSNYLITRLAGELMRPADDERMQSYLSDEPGSGGAGDMLRKYLIMKDDPSTAPKNVTLDRRLFKTGLQALRNTKTIGW